MKIEDFKFIRHLLSKSIIKDIFNNNLSKKKNILLSYLKGNFDNIYMVSTMDKILKLEKSTQGINWNTLLLSYRVFTENEEKPKLVPICFRTYYGKWQLSSGACSGVMYLLQEDENYSVNEVYYYGSYKEMLKQNKIKLCKGELWGILDLYGDYK